MKYNPNYYLGPALVDLTVQSWRQDKLSDIKVEGTAALSSSMGMTL